MVQYNITTNTNNMLNRLICMIWIVWMAILAVNSKNDKKADIKYGNINMIVPSCNNINISQIAGTNKHYIINISTNANTNNGRLGIMYVTSNMDVNVYSRNRTLICGGVRVCQFSIDSSAVSTQVILKTTANTVHDRQQPLIICLNFNQLYMFAPLNKGTLSHFYRQASGLTKHKQQLTGSFYLFKPYSQSLRLHFHINQGYLLLVPYICPQYDLRNCTHQLQHKIRSINSQIAFNYYMLLFKITLFRHQSIFVDYCNLCYWIIYVDCKIGTCSSNFGFQYSDTPLLNNVSNHIKVNSSSNSIQLKQGRFNNLYQLNSLVSHKHPFYEYQTYMDSQIAYFPTLPHQPVYLSCSHYPRTLVLRVSGLQTLLIQIPKNSDKSYQNKLTKTINCQIRVECLSCLKSQLYYSNLQLRSIQLSKKYPIKLTRSRPAIMHYQLQSSSVYLTIRKCTQAPIKLSYFFVPDYDAIKSRIPQQGEQSKQFDDWVVKRQVRITDNQWSQKIAKSQYLYMTNNIVFQIVPDTYSYIQLSIQPTKPKLNQKDIIKHLIFQSEEYAQDHTNTNQIKFKFNINLEKSEPNITVQQLTNKITLVQSQKPDPIQLKLLCPHIKFIELFNEESTQMSSMENSIIVNQTENSFNVTIQGKSAMKYLSIMLQEQNSYLYKVLQLKSKINLFEKYAWLLVVSGITVMFMFLGTFRLLVTRAKKR